MSELRNGGARPRKSWRMAGIAAALLGAAALCQPDIANAAHGGGGGGLHGGGGFHAGGFGGFHGGGFHGGGFHGGGFHGDGFHGGGVHGGGFHVGGAALHNGFGEGHGGDWHHGWHNGRYGWWWGGGLGGSYYPYADGWDDYNDYNQPYANQTWYYCSDPAGYYPYVTQCNTGWQAVPAS